MGDAALSEKASRILGDLELGSLRTHYGSLPPRTFEPKSSRGRDYFHLQPIGFASSPAEKQAQQREARALNISRKILARRIELAADGIWPSVVSGSDAGHDELSVFVEFSERGRRVLAGTGLAFSEALGFIRRFLWIGCCGVALVLVGAALGERIWRSGWQQTLVGILALVAFAVLIRKPWR